MTDRRVPKTYTIVANFLCVRSKKIFHFEGQFHVEEEGNVPRSGISQNMAGWRLAIECTMRNTVRPLANSPHN